MTEIRKVVRKTYERLFPNTDEGSSDQEDDPLPPVIAVLGSDSESEEGAEGIMAPPAQQRSYGEQVSQLFDVALNAHAHGNQVRLACLHL